MGAYATKAFFKKKLKEYKQDGENFFEVYPAPDCCLRCEEKANIKIEIVTSTKEDYPPFHRQCRCSIIPLGDNEQPGALAKLKARYASGELPYKRCLYCQEWINWNSITCNKCGKIQNSL